MPKRYKVAIKMMWEEENRCLSLPLNGLSGIVTRRKDNTSVNLYFFFWVNNIEGMPEKKRVGRPRKGDNEGTEQQIKRRLYMRKYNARIKQDVLELDKMERECMEELDKIRKEKLRLINELDKANNQAMSILREKMR